MTHGDPPCLITRQDLALLAANCGYSYISFPGLNYDAATEAHSSELIHVYRSQWCILAGIDTLSSHIPSDSISRYEQQSPRLSFSEVPF